MTEIIPLHLQVRAKRREIDMKQSYLATKSGLSQSLISRFEAGILTNIGIDNLRKISIALEFYEWDLNLSITQF